jgi:hypothetical protein
LGRWQRYWFAEGGRGAAAIVRMAIAAAVLMTLWRLATLSTVHLPGPPELYRPVGMWMLLGRTPPPVVVVDALWALAWGGTVAMLVGLYTRVATAVSCAAALALVSLSFASSASWSHQYNVVFLAQIAFLGARGGDVLSIDAMIRRWRRLPPVEVARGYQWSLRLVQLAVALMFAGAAFHKLLHGHFTLRWALSDNLRNQLLVRYDLAGLARPALADWIINDVWRYRVVAVLNLISQSLPILACFFVRRPLLRALTGGFFLLEVIALDQVVGLWNPHWLPLAAVFVDWDRLWGAVARSYEHPPATPADWRPPLTRRIFIIAFIVYDAVTALVPTADQKLNTYPFSGFPMFATVRARAPYDEHQPYTIPGDQFEVISDRPLTERQQSWLDQTYRRLESVRDPEILRKKLTAILRDIQQRFADAGIRGIRHYLVIFEAPAYPAPAHFEPHRLALTGEIDRDGVFRTALGAIGPSDVTLRPQGLDAGGARLSAYRDDGLEPHELTSQRDGDRFLTGAIAGDPLYVVATIEGRAWLVGSRKAWRWE